MNPDFIIYRFDFRIFIAHKLPGELRIIAEIESQILDVEQQERYAKQIVDALNKESK